MPCSIKSGQQFALLAEKNPHAFFIVRLTGSMAPLPILGAFSTTGSSRAARPRGKRCHTPQSPLA